MKIFLLLPLLCVATLVNAQIPVNLDGPVITVKSTEYDYGTLQKSEKGTYAYCNFEVQNTGNEPLIISKCKGSCGCTVPQCSSEAILPGGTSLIKVKYDSSRLGSFTKSVSVFSNASNSAELKLNIKGTVVDLQ
ncbi:MAG: DUF1573 domain-containing protein [Flavobacteriales bacterium]